MKQSKIAQDFLRTFFLLKLASCLPYPGFEAGKKRGREEDETETRDSRNIDTSNLRREQNEKLPSQREEFNFQFWGIRRSRCLSQNPRDDQARIYKIWAPEKFNYISSIDNISNTLLVFSRATFVLFFSPRFFSRRYDRWKRAEEKLSRWLFSRCTQLHSKWTARAGAGKGRGGREESFSLGRDGPANWILQLGVFRRVPVKRTSRNWSINPGILLASRIFVATRSRHLRNC